MSETVSVLLSNEDIAITFCATCAFCCAKTDGTVTGEEITSPTYSTVTLKHGWGTIQLNTGLRVWCGGCNPTEGEVLT